MNRTDDEPQTETDVMATALSTMRKYGMDIITATQFMDVTAYVKSDPRMPRTRLRRYLGQYGLRGEALNREIRRIVAGPERPDNSLKAGMNHDISVIPGEDYARKALTRLTVQYLSTGDNKQ